MTETTMTEPPSDWATSTFDERYLSTYEQAWAFSNAITHDREKSQEVVHDAFMVLHNRIDNGASRTRSWFFAIVRNKSLDAWREQKRRQKIGTLESEFGSATSDGKIIPFLETLADETTLPPDQAAEQNDAATLIDKMRGFLTDERREIFDLGNEAVFQTEAAERLGISENAFKMRWRSIRTVLRDRFCTHYASL